MTNKLVLEWRNGLAIATPDVKLSVQKNKIDWQMDVLIGGFTVDRRYGYKSELEAQLACESALRSIVEPVMGVFGGQPAVAEEWGIYQRKSDVGCHCGIRTGQLVMAKIVKSPLGQEYDYWDIKYDDYSGSALLDKDFRESFVRVFGGVGVPTEGNYQRMANAAEMLWAVVANAGGGDWSKETQEWQEAAIRWRDNYFAVLRAHSYATPQAPPTQQQIDGLVKEIDRLYTKEFIPEALHSGIREERIYWLLKRHFGIEEGR